MWHDALRPDYAIVCGCLVLREFFGGKCYFHYPLSLSGDEKEELAAIAALEKFCRDTGERLHFTNVPESRVMGLIARYGEAHVTNNRRWRDYLYLAENFKTYPGKKFAGRRNHVHKFEKLYPDWSFSEASPSDMGGLDLFLKEYETVQRSKQNYLADEEMDEVYAILPHLKDLALFAGILRVGGKIVGFSVGERCGDMVVVHIEKALRDYEGVYPFLAQQFAKTFCGEEILYLNRMDDAGDLGLRKSKLQYDPVEIVPKYNVIPKRAIDTVFKLPTIKTERLTLRPVADEDAADYARLASDTERNRYWGYDYREDWKRPTPPKARWFLEGEREDFSHRREMPLGIYEGTMFVGEVTFHRFGYAAEAEIGVRLLPEAEGKGYAAEAVRAYTEFGFSRLNLERVEAKCFCENERSRKMLLSAGLCEDGTDGIYFYFYRTAET